MSILEDKQYTLRGGPLDGCSGSLQLLPADRRLRFFDIEETNSGVSGIIDYIYTLTVVDGALVAEYSGRRSNSDLISACTGAARRR